MTSDFLSFYVGPSVNLSGPITNDAARPHFPVESFTFVPIRSGSLSYRLLD
jgi:hypothetical protein